MLKPPKKGADALMAVTPLARHYGEGACCTRDIAQAYGIPAGLLAKVLQRLVRKGLLKSQHGMNGGYTLAKPPLFMSALEVIHAVDGPVMITSCITARGECFQTPLCTVKEPLRRVNERIVNALNSFGDARAHPPGG